MLSVYKSKCIGRFLFIDDVLHFQAFYLKRSSHFYVHFQMYVLRPVCLPSAVWLPDKNSGKFFDKELYAYQRYFISRVSPCLSSLSSLKQGFFRSLRRCLRENYNCVDFFQWWKKFSLIHRNHILSNLPFVWTFYQIFFTKFDRT